ncbi:MAG: phosphotransferase, partial [Gammaproteobacteria bacterium]|nr:phosphotransferase [Gammaproteobacteria bacterium]
MRVRPDFTTAEAEALARDRYGILARARELPSERDRNFLLRATGDGQDAGGQLSGDDAGAGATFVLKIGNATEARASLEMQGAILARLARRWLEDDGALRSPFPAVVPDLAGAPLATVERRGIHYPLRLVTWLPGVPVAEVRPQSPEFLRSWGGVLARLNAALADFEHPAAETGFHWDLRTASSIFEERAGSVKGRDRRALLRRRMADCQ